MKPQMILNMRISVDSTQKQRYSEKEIITEFNNDNIKIVRKLVIRKNDGAVMGEILNNIENKVCPFCNNNSVYEIKNQRADASFEFFVHCDKCKKWIGKINWKGDYIILKQNS